MQMEKENTYIQTGVNMRGIGKMVKDTVLGVHFFIDGSKYFGKQKEGLRHGKGVENFP